MRKTFCLCRPTYTCAFHKRGAYAVPHLDARSNVLFMRDGDDHDLDIALGRTDWRKIKCPQCNHWMEPCHAGGDPAIGCIDCTIILDLCEIEAKLEGK